ncbi:MAG: universal stress protein [Myxococcales bacterium]|nr:universal stress protein [Myxococcales bacterium]
MNTVVIGTDFSAYAKSALDVVRDFAARWHIQRIHLVAVIEPITWASASTASAGVDLSAMAMEAARRRLDGLRFDVSGVNVTRDVRLGSPARELALAASEQGANLVVTGTHGRTGIERAALGSVSSDLIRVSNVPVLVVPAHGLSSSSKLSQVLAAVDLSEVSREVISYAGQLAAIEESGSVTVLSLFESPIIETASDEVLPHFPSQEETTAMEADYRQQVAQLVDAVDLSVPVNIEVLRKAPPAQVILDVASLTKADLIVLGTSGRNAWHRMIVGSTATRVLNEATCPILIVPNGSSYQVASKEN